MHAPLRILIAASFVLLAPVAHAAERVALVIGNGDYRHAVALPNPRNDASDIARLLERLGFLVVQGNDLTRAGMEDAIRRFASASADAETVLFFYAGHGMQVAGRNYLIPVDAELAERTALDFEAIDVDKVFQYMTGSGKVALAFLDACRNNPLSRNFARSLGPTRSTSVGDGLAPTNTAGSGLFIAYATAPNDVAQDGEGRNSPFTTALLRHLPERDTEIQQVMTRVKADVQRSTKGAQRPWHNSDLSTEVYLIRTPPEQLERSEELEGSEADAVFWEAVRNSDDASLLRVFLERFPASRYLVEAETKLAALEGTSQPDLKHEVASSPAVRQCRLFTEVLDGRIVDVGRRRVRPREILEACQKATAEAPNDVDVAYRLAAAHNNLDNYREYERALIRAAELGSWDAKLRLGTAWVSSWSDLTYDPDRGIRLLLEVAEEKSPENRMNAVRAASMLTSQFQYGPAKDEQKQRYWYDRYVDLIKAAADAGEPEAMYSLGYDYMFGKGARLLQDPPKARELFEAAVAKGYVWALQPLTNWYTRGETGFEKNPRKAAEHAREYERVMSAAYELGLNSALINIAGLYDSSGPTPDIRKAIELYKTAAAEGVVLAYWNLSYKYGSKDNTAIYNPSEAERWNLKYLAAKGNCGSSPHEAIQKLHPDIEMLSTPEKAARCYLDAVKRFDPVFWHVAIRGVRSPFLKNYDPVPRQTKMAIQRMLKEEGYYSGPVDGVFGNGTYNALEAYKKQ